MSTEEKVELILDNLLDNNFLIGSAVKKLMSIIEEEKRIAYGKGFDDYLNTNTQTKDAR